MRPSEQKVLDAIAAAGPEGVIGRELRRTLDLSKGQIKWALEVLYANVLISKTYRTIQTPTEKQPHHTNQCVAYFVPKAPVVPPPKSRLEQIQKTVHSALLHVPDPNTINPQEIIKDFRFLLTIIEDAVPILAYVSAGRGYVGVARYPDAEARALLGKLGE